MYDPEGKLIGLLAFERGPLRYVLPMEYLTNGKKALAMHHDLIKEVSAGVDSEAFAKHRAAANAVTEALPEPLSYDRLANAAGFSATALLVELQILVKKETPVHTESLDFSLMAINPTKQRREIVAGKVPTKYLRWLTDADTTETVVQEQTMSFGDVYVAESILPFEFGLLRLRIPFTPFCRKITQKDAHALIVTLPDGRRSPDMMYHDLALVCGGIGVEDGTALEREWGFKAEPAPKPAKAPKKPAKKKKKKKRKGKKRRR